MYSTRLHKKKNFVKHSLERERETERRKNGLNAIIIISFTILLCVLSLHPRHHFRRPLLLLSLFFFFYEKKALYNKREKI